MIVEQSGSLVLRLERLIRADRTRVFAAWTEPDQLRQWSAPQGMEVVQGSTDLRVGGAWDVVMKQEDGSRHEAFGRYLEITPPARLVYTHAWRQGDASTPETVVTIDFHPVPDGTLLTLTQEGFATAASRDGHGEGWASTVDSLEAWLAGSAGAAAAGAKPTEAEGAGAPPAAVGPPADVTTLRHQASVAAAVVRLNLQDITHGESLLQPSPAGNCMNWVLGHLVAVYDGCIPLLGGEPVLSEAVAARYARGSAPLQSPAEAQPLHTLLAAWDEASARMDRGLSGLTPARLEQRTAHSPTGDPEETLGSLLSTVMFHQAYHAGQLGLLRRLVGREGAIP